MADNYYLTDLTTTIQLDYNAVSQPTYKALYGATVGGQEPQARWHQADGYPAELTELVHPNRQAFFGLIVENNGGGNDTVLNGVAALRRLVNQAARYSLDGDAKRVYLKVQLDGATNATLMPVIYGDVDDSGSFYSAVAQINDVAWDAALMLMLEPYGQAASAITLKNILINPSFEVESGTAGLAAGWTPTGTATRTLSATNYLIGGKSQGITATAASSGVYQSWTATATSCVAYAWIRTPSVGAVTVVLRNDTLGTNVSSVVLDTGNSSTYDKTAIGAGGSTWYRVVVAGASAVGATMILYVLSSGGAATFYCDGAYVQEGTTTAPDAWSSYYAIQNRGDTSATNPTYINHLDVWGVPGDAPALVKLTVDLTSTSTLNPKRLYLSRQVDGEYLVTQRPHWIEADNFDTAVNTSGTGAWSTGTGTSNNQYRRFTEGVTNNGGYAYLSASYLGSNPPLYVYNPPRRVLACVRSSTTNTDFSATTSDSSWPVELVSGSSKSVTNANTWEILDLGLMNATGVLRGTGANAVLKINITGMANTNTADVDWVMLLPVGFGDDFVTTQTRTTVASTSDVVFDGPNRRIYVSDARAYAEAALGSCWYAEPGALLNRFVLLKTEDDDEYVLTKTFAVTTEVTPRSRHLLGTA